jgi:hypothetical protein
MHALSSNANFPTEILDAPVWCVAGRDKDGKTKLPLNPYTRKPADVTDPETWGTFEDACAVALEMGLFLADGVTPAVGHVLRLSDGIFVIDFDKCATSQSIWRIQQEVMELFDSYTEESQSGNGLHTYARGFLHKGKKFKSGSFEIYGHARFIVATGQPILDEPIYDHGLTLARFLEEHAPPESQFEFNVTAPAVLHALDKLAENSFVRTAFLKPGGWRDWGITDHSLADHAFMKEILRVTPNHKQALELFTASPMGQREKWQTRPEYRLWTLENAFLEVETNKRDETRLALSFLASCPQTGSQAPDMTAFVESAKAEAAAVVEQQHVIKNYLPDNLAIRVPMSRAYLGITEPITAAQELLSLPVYKSDYITGRPPHWEAFKVGTDNSGYKHVKLHGFLGELAEEIKQLMFRPSLKVAEMVALVVAQAIIGKGAMSPGTGLNLFLNMVGGSGVGKSEAKSIAVTLVHSLQQRYELADRVMNDLPKSKEGLYAAIKNSFANELTVTIDESQKFLKEMSGSKHGVSIAEGTGTLLTEIFTESKPNGKMLASAASKAENSREMIFRPHVSLLMYGLHAATLEAINGDMLHNGFASRLLFVHVEDDEVARQMNRSQFKNVGYSEQSLHRLGAIARFFDKFRSNDVEPFEVEFAPHVWERHCTFADWAHEQVSVHNKPHFNRAAVNAQKLSSIIAIFNDPKAAVVTEEVYDWAITFVLSSLNYIEKALASGNLGGIHEARVSAITSRLARYFTQFPTVDLQKAQLRKLKINPMAADFGLIPTSWLVQQVQSVSAFKDERFPPAKIVQDVLKQMDSDELVNFYHVDSRTGSFAQFDQSGGKVTIKASMVGAKNLLEMYFEAQQAKQAESHAPENT